MGGLVTRLGVGKWLPHWGLRGERSGHDLSADPDMELQQKEFETVVLEAIDEGDLDLLKYLHEQESFVFWGGIDSVPSNPPLLHRAAAKGHMAVVEYLLCLGMDPDDTDSSGMTSIHVACKTLENACLPPLVARSRDIDKRDVWGRTPLIKALVYRNVEAAEILLEKGANPNATDIYGITPLTTAIDYNMMYVLSQLVRHGADINLITHHNHGRSCSGPPLYLAVNNQNLDVVRELLRLGAATQPQMHHYAVSTTNTTTIAGLSQLATNSTAWNYIGLGTVTATTIPTSFTPSLSFSDAVSLAMSEVVRRGEASISDSSAGIKVLMELLAGHGYPLGSSPDILIRVLLNSQKPDNNFSRLLYKLQICSSSCSEDILLRMAWSEGQIVSGASNVQQALRQPPRMVSSLQNQARRAARKALMGSYHNVSWACSRLQCPPALKSLLLLKDVDRAFANSSQSLATQS